MNWESYWLLLTVSLLVIVFAGGAALTRTLRHHRLDMDRRIRSALADFLQYQDTRNNDDDDGHLLVLGVNLPDDESLTPEARSLRSRAKSKYIESGRLRERYQFIHNIKLVSDDELGRRVEETYLEAEDRMMAGIEIQRKAGKYVNYLGEQK